MIIITDLDNCIVDDSWRYDWLTAGEFDEYHRASCLDAAPIVDHLFPLDVGDRLVILTGRPERYRKQTFSYLLKHGLGNIQIKMRPNHDKRTSPEFKVATIVDNFDISDIKIAYDDRLDVIEAYRKYDINCMLHSLNKR